MWVVALKNRQSGLKRIVKRYPFKIQCVIWCYLKGFVVSGDSDFGKPERYTFLCYWPDMLNTQILIEEEPDV